MIVMNFYFGLILYGFISDVTGDLLSGKIKCSKNKREPRSLIVQLHVELSSFLPDTEPVCFQQQYFLR